MESMDVQYVPMLPRDSWVSSSPSVMSEESVGSIMGSTGKSDISVVLSHMPARQDAGAAKADLAWREEVVVQLIISGLMGIFDVSLFRRTAYGSSYSSNLELSVFYSICISRPV